jgi:hypothetical protein
MKNLPSIIVLKYKILKLVQYSFYRPYDIRFSRLDISIKLFQNEVDGFFLAFGIQSSFDTSDRLLIQFNCFLTKAMLSSVCCYHKKRHYMAKINKIPSFVNLSNYLFKSVGTDDLEHQATSAAHKTIDRSVDFMVKFRSPYFHRQRSQP